MDTAPRRRRDNGAGAYGGADMDDEVGWITEDAAIEWVSVAYGIPRDVAHVEAAKAVRTGLIRYRDKIAEKRDGRLVPIPPRLSLLGANLYFVPRLHCIVHAPLLKEDTFKWVIRRQLGEPPALKAPSRTRKPPKQDALDKALFGFAKQQGRKLKQSDAAARAVLVELGATTRQISKAYRSLPAEYTYRRGSPGKTSE